MHYIPFPQGTKLIEVLPSDRRCSGAIFAEFIVEHDDFGEVAEGNMYPERTFTVSGSEEAPISEPQWEPY